MGLLPRGLKNNDILTIILIVLLIITLVHHLSDLKPKKVILLRESDARQERVPFFKATYSKSPFKDQIPPVNNSTGQTPLCIITTWDQKRFPDYGYLSLESIARNGADFVKLFVFYHSTTENLPNSNQFPNVEWIDLADLDEEYVFDGFAAFYGSKMCSIMDLEQDSQECRFLRGSIRYGSLRESGDSIHMPLRAYYGRLFEEWVGPSLCDAWSWGELDTMYGNMKTWLQGNPLVWSNDVFTVAGIDWKSLYPRKSLAVHVQTRDATLVNNLWKHSSKLKDYDFLSNAIVRGKPFVIEEHYTEGLLESRIKFAILPWLGEAMSNRQVDFTLVIQNALWTVSGCDSEAQCREKLAAELHKRIVPIATKEYGARYYTIHARLERDARKCPHHNHIKIGKCLESSLQLPKSVDEGDSMFIVQMEKGQMELFIWKKAPEDLLKRRVDQVALFDLSSWSDNIQLPFKKEIELSASRFY